jgi:hypothetical protein
MNHQNSNNFVSSINSSSIYNDYVTPSFSPNQLPEFSTSSSSYFQKPPNQQEKVIYSNSQSQYNGSNFPNRKIINPVNHPNPSSFLLPSPSTFNNNLQFVPTANVPYSEIHSVQQISPISNQNMLKQFQQVNISSPNNKSPNLLQQYSADLSSDSKMGISSPQSQLQYTTLQNQILQFQPETQNHQQQIITNSFIFCFTTFFYYIVIDVGQQILIPANVFNQANINNNVQINPNKNAGGINLSGNDGVTLTQQMGGINSIPASFPLFGYSPSTFPTGVPSPSFFYFLFIFIAFFLYKNVLQKWAFYIYITLCNSILLYWTWSICLTYTHSS